jgi:hypothetical protein
MIDILHQPGFLGTNANFAADATLLVSIIVALLLTLGFYLARKGKYDLHKWLQTIAAMLNLIMVLWLMVLPFRDFILRDSGGPRLSIFYSVTSVHALVGLAAVLFGNFVVLRGHKLVPKFLRFQNYKTPMRIAYGLYLLNTMVGLWVYITWFITIPNPPVF